MKLPYIKNKEGCIIKVSVKTGCKMAGLEGIDGDKLKIRVRSMPQNGEANRELIDIVSELFCVPKTKIDIIKGLTSRNKILKILGDID